MLEASKDIIGGLESFNSVPAAAALRRVRQEKVTDWLWLEEFVAARGDLGRKQFADWERRRGRFPGWSTFRRAFEAVEHKRLYTLTVDEVMDACLRTTHSIEGVTKEEAKHRKIHNFSPPVPMVLIFHDLLEILGRVPVWDDVRRHVYSGRPELMWEPFCREFGIKVGEGEGVAGSPSMQAFKWRLGTAYYAWLREIHMLTVLRSEFGFDLDYHFLADAEWKADFVAGNILIELYLKNPDYKDGQRGRKVTCREFNPGFQVVDVFLDSESVGGHPWLVKRHVLEETARRLEDLGCRRVIV